MKEFGWKNSKTELPKEAGKILAEIVIKENGKIVYTDYFIVMVSVFCDVYFSFMYQGIVYEKAEYKGKLRGEFHRNLEFEIRSWTDIPQPKGN